MGRRPESRHRRKDTTFAFRDGAGLGHQLAWNRRKDRP
jgi:hypothetical protein